MPAEFREPASEVPSPACAHGGGEPAAGDGPSLGAVLAAGLVVADVLAHLRGMAAAGADAQVGIDAATGAIRRHPVLAVPGNLLREAG